MNIDQPSMATSSCSFVAYSDRLGAITDIERALETEGLASVQRVPLWSVADVQKNAADAVVAMIGAVEPMSREALERMPYCRALVRRGAGYNNVDVAAATALGIPVAYVPDASVEEVSDHALALLLSLERRLLQLDTTVRARGQALEAMAGERRTIRRLKTLTLGVVGLGRIGRALAGKASDVFGEVIGSDPFPTPDIEREVRLVAFDDLIACSDLVSIHVPLTPSTHHLFDADVFSRMKAGAYIVNTSRGGLIDEAAMIEAINSGRLAGAALDVTEVDPIQPGSAILSVPGVILTGHSAAMSVTSVIELRKRSVDVVRSVLVGKTPKHLANPEVLEQDNLRLVAR